MSRRGAHEEMVEAAVTAVVPSLATDRARFERVGMAARRRAGEVLNLTQASSLFDLLSEVADGDRATPPRRPLDGRRSR